MRYSDAAPRNGPHQNSIDRGSLSASRLIASRSFVTGSLPAGRQPVAQWHCGQPLLSSRETWAAKKSAPRIRCAVATIFQPSVSLPPVEDRLISNARQSDFQASVGFIPAEPQLVSNRQAIRLPGFRRVHPGGATTGQQPSGNPTSRLPSGSSRRSHNWSATVRQSDFQASVGFIPAEPQLVSNRQAIRLPGFRRVYPGGATTGQQPSGNPTSRLPSGSSRRSHNWSATRTP